MHRFESPLEAPDEQTIREWASAHRRAHTGSHSKLPRPSTTSPPLWRVASALAATALALLFLQVFRSWMRYVWVLWIPVALYALADMFVALARVRVVTLTVFVEMLDRWLFYTVAVVNSLQLYHTLASSTYERFFAGAASLSSTTSAYDVWTYFLFFTVNIHLGAGNSSLTAAHWSTRLIVPLLSLVSYLYRIALVSLASCALFTSRQ